MTPLQDLIAQRKRQYANGHTGNAKGFWCIQMNEEYPQKMVCNEMKLIIVPRYTVIDGKTVKVENCGDCPFYNEGDGGWGNSCRYPFNHADLPYYQFSKSIPPNDCPLSTDTHVN